MPTLPSLSQAFSALGSSLKVPAASSFNLPGPAPVSPINYQSLVSPGQSLWQTPAVPSFSPTPAKQNMSVAPAVPNMSTPAPNMSTPKGPVYAPPPVPPAVPKVPAVTTPLTQTPAAAPVVPQQQPYRPQPPVTMNSGAMVDPNTGSVITPSTGGQTFTADTSGGVGVNTGNATGGTDYSGSAGATPAIPAIDDSSNMSTNPLFDNPTDQAAFDAYMATLTPGQDEIDTQTQLNNLNNSASQAYTDASGQAIPLPFITGQQAQLQREQATLANPLESTLSLLQAKRQMAQTASKAALDREDAKIAALRSMSAPIATTYGGTLSSYNASTGQYQTIVNPFGSASDTTSGAPSTTDVIGQAIASGQLTSDQVTRYGIPFIAATLAADPGYNFVTQKASVAADSASLKTQQTYLDTTQRAFNTAQDNLSAITQYMTTAGINTTSTVPLINDLTNKVKAGALDPGTIAGYNAAIAGLRAEYAQVLSRGGEVTDTSRSAAIDLIPNDLTPAQLQQVADRLNIEGSNAVKEATAQVKKITTKIGGNTGGSNTSDSNDASTNPFSATSFFGQ